MGHGRPVPHDSAAVWCPASNATARLTRVFVQSGVHGIDDVTVVVSKVRAISVSTIRSRATGSAVASSACAPFRASDPTTTRAKTPPTMMMMVADARNPSRTPSRDAKTNAQTKRTSDWRREHFRERPRRRSHSGPSRWVKRRAFSFSLSLLSVFQAKNVAILESRNHSLFNKKGGVLVYSTTRGERAAERDLC